MILARKFALALIAAALLPLHAGAAVLPGGSPAMLALTQDDGSSQDEDNAQGKDRGVFQGEIVGIDYARAILHLQTARQGRIDIQILPSTSIMRRADQYGTIADLAPGVRVLVYVSEVMGHLTAQIIRIR
ncbi:MAG: hypothetical protein NVS1B14_12510 [Vulcanimicrobiaceae bacterium]